MDTSERTEAAYACKSCAIGDYIGRMFCCYQCNLTPICGHCAMKNHQGHQCVGFKDLQENFNDWYERSKTRFDEIRANKDEISGNVVHARTLCQYLIQALESFETAIVRIDKDKEAVDAAVEMTNDWNFLVSGQFDNKRLNELSNKMNSLANKQTFLQTSSRSLVEILRNGGKLMKEVLPRVCQGYELVKENNQTTDGAAAAAGRQTQIGNIYVSHLDKTISNEELLDIFSRFGRILSAKAVKDDDGLCKGHGYVQFENEEDAQKAIIEARGGKLFHKNNKICAFPYMTAEERQEKGIFKKVPTAAPQKSEPNPGNNTGVQSASNGQGQLPTTSIEMDGLPPPPYDSFAWLDQYVARGKML